MNYVTFPVTVPPSGTVNYYGLRRKYIYQDAAEQMGGQLEITPMETGRRRVLKFPRIKVSDIEGRTGKSLKGSADKSSLQECVLQ